MASPASASKQAVEPAALPTPIQSSGVENKASPVKPTTAPAAVPAGYQIVKIRKPDGTIIRVKRPIAPVGPATTSSTIATAPNPIQSPAVVPPATSNVKTAVPADTPRVSSKDNSTEDTKYEIVTIKNPDGTTQKVKKPISAAPISAAAPKTPHPVPTASTHTTSTPTASIPTASPPTASIPTASTPTAPATSGPASKAVAQPADPSKPVAPPQVPQQASPPAVTSPAAAPGVHAADIATEQRFFGRLGGNGLRLGLLQAAASIHPSWGDIGELRDGDEYYDDGEDFDSADEDEDEDDDDDIQHDGAEVNGHEANETGHSGSSDAAEKSGTHEVASAVGTQVLMGATQGLTAAPPAYAANQNAANQNGPQTQPPRQGTADIRPSAAPNGHVLTNRAKNGAEISEKELPDSVDEKDVKPTRPARPLKHRPFTISRVFMWAIMTLLPLLFIVLGIMTATLTNTPSPSTLGEGIAQANKIAVTLWPIIFAALVAQSLRALATYKVERGIRLMTLEQLINSNSVASTVKQPFLLWRFDWISIGLLAMWTLSPLASQAMQRMAYSGESMSATTTTVWYMNTWSSNLAFQPISDFDRRAGETDDNGTVIYGSDVNLLYHAALLPQGEYASSVSDAWLQPYIPLIEPLLNQTAGADGWYTVPENARYASQYGVPIEKFAVEGDYDFSIVASYLHFDCPVFNLKTFDQLNKTQPPLKKQTFVEYGDDDSTLYMKIVPHTATSAGQLYLAAENEIPVDGGGTQAQDLYTYSACNFTQKFVESKISCHYQDKKNDCWATSVRPYTATALPPTPMRDFSVAFFNASGTLAERYLMNPRNFSAGIELTRNISSIGVDNFTARLQTLINTFWQLGFSPEQAVTGFDHNAGFSYGANANSSTARLTVTKPVYLTSWPWLAVLLVSSVFLLLCGVAAMLWDAHTIGPDVFGFASSVARRSRYIDLPKTDSTMDGPEKARLLGDVRVMMQDVKPKADVGRIALGNKHEKAEKLVLGRMYK